MDIESFGALYESSERRHIETRLMQAHDERVANQGSGKDFKGWAKMLQEALDGPPSSRDTFEALKRAMPWAVQG